MKFKPLIFYRKILASFDKIERLEEHVKNLEAEMQERVRNLEILSAEHLAIKERVKNLEVLSSQHLATKERLKELEILLTEHPQAASRGLVKTPHSSPVVSIIMPTWNRAKIISDAIFSVQSQDFIDWELIIVDDGSTDDTAQIVATFSSDQRIRYVQQAHAGQSNARNHALRLAHGVFMAYLDSDNLWYPQFLRVAMTHFVADPKMDSAYGALVSEIHGEGPRVFWKLFERENLKQANFIDLNTFIHHRRLFELYGGFDESFDQLEDWDLVLRYTQHSDAKSLFVLAVRYRTLDGQRVSNRPTYEKNFQQLIQKTELKQ